MVVKPINKITDNLEQLVGLLPPKFAEELQKQKDFKELTEIVLDLGRVAEFRFANKNVVYFEGQDVTQEDIDYVVSKVGQFTTDNRAGIERTLHRISAMRNRQGKIIGLTCRVGRAVIGTVDIISDIIKSGKNLLVLGGPGVGKTTKLREIARILSTEYKKRVIVIDTSNEIAGDGDIPHPGIGLSRRMQVSSPDRQHAVMIEAVENHMPEVIIVDEIGTEAEAQAARTIAERGVQLVGTAHGNSIKNLIKNPTLSDLVGGIQSVILGDEEAKRRNTQKAILERKAPPTFEVLVEIHERNALAIFHDIATVVDNFLRGKMLQPEIRKVDPDGSIRVVQEASQEDFPIPLFGMEAQEEIESKLAIYPFGINRARVERAIRVLGVKAQVTMNLDDADMVLTIRSQSKPNSKIIKAMHGRKIPLHVIKSDSSSQINRFLRYIFKLYSDDEERLELAIKEIEDVIAQVERTNKPAEAAPASAYIRRVQHQVVEKKGYRAESISEEPNRRVRVYPLT
ncbi:MAG: AAA family ATPase [Candidatus Margulisbacteria bacterium]|nr:AAA family ATPase [Candidatus Margulisiibacteriota bacterium]